MEDVVFASAGVFPSLQARTAVFCLFDGHGGDYVSTAVARMFSAGIDQICPQRLMESPQQALTEVFLKADRLLLESKMSQRCGSCALVTFLIGDNLYVANAGDSAAVLSKGGQAFPLNKLHTPTDAAECERIKAAGGIVDYGKGEVQRVYTADRRGGLMVTRALGDGLLKGPHGEGGVLTAEPAVTVVPLTAADDFYVLATDGVWDVLSPEQVVHEIVKRKLKCPQKAAEKVLRAARRRGAADNISVVVVFLNHPPASLPLTRKSSWRRFFDRS